MTTHSIKSLLLCASAALALGACGGDGTAELGSPGNTGANPGVGTGTGGTTGGTGGTSTGPCPTGTTSVTVGTQTHCRLPATITGSLRLTAGPLYQLNGAVYVGQDQGPDASAPIAGRTSGTLTIDPGVTVYGATPVARLIVSRGSRLIADGTVTQPITFTSANDLGFGTVLGLPTPRDPLPASAKDDPYRGEWGGLSINGRGQLNVGPAPASSTVCAASTISQAEAEGDSGCYGGNNDDDNSGVLRYVRVKYAGVQFTPENELNGIAFWGAGRGTTVDYVQVHNGADDCFEWFGGAVKAKHLVCTGSNDDGFDWTFGWRGAIQYGIVVANPFVNTVSDEFGIEADNATTNFDSSPRANPVFSNITIQGVPGATAFPDTGARLRRGTAGRLLNLVIGGGWANGGLIMSDAATKAQFDANALQLKSWFITAGSVGTPVRGVITQADFQSSAAGGSSANVVGTGSLQPAVPGGRLYVNGSQENAVVAVNPVTQSGGDTFFDATNYIGAVRDGGSNWTVGWTVWLNN